MSEADRSFKRDLLATVPSLRAFAMSLIGRHDNKLSRCAGLVAHRDAGDDNILGDDGTVMNRLGAVDFSSIRPQKNDSRRFSVKVSDHLDMRGRGGFGDPRRSKPVTALRARGMGNRGRHGVACRGRIAGPGSKRNGRDDDCDCHHGKRDRQGNGCCILHSHDCLHWGDGTSFRDCRLAGGLVCARRD